MVQLPSLRAYVDPTNKEDLRASRSSALLGSGLTPIADGLCNPVHLPECSIDDNRRMFTPTRGDVILRASIDGAFTVVDATSLARLAGPLPLQAALIYATDRGAPHIFQQAVDKRGRPMGDALLLPTR